MSDTDDKIRVEEKSESPINSDQINNSNPTKNNTITTDLINNNINGNNASDINTDQNVNSLDTLPQNNLATISEDVSNVRKQYDELESLVVTQLKNNNTSLNEFLKSLKTIAHNQDVLENKLEDAMKNQMNTDILVNNMNQRLNLISNVINTKNWKKSKEGSVSNSLKDGTNKMVMSEYNNKYNSVNGNSSNSKRGPGRPRKDTSKFINNDFKSLETSHTNDLSAVKVSLPTGTVQLSKSKRYFVDPTDSNNNSMSPIPPSSISSNRKPRSRGRPKRYDDDSDENSDGSDETDSEQSDSDISSFQHTQPKKRGRKPKKTKRKIKREEPEVFEKPPKRRGRPPKLRTVETVITSSPNTRTNTLGSDHSHNASNLTALINNSPDKDVSMIDNEARHDLSDLDVNDTNQNSESTSLENDPDNKINIPITKVFPFKKQTELDKDHFNKDIHTGEFNLDKQSNEDKEQQMKLDKLRDSREKMLTSLKYNDRARAKSFMDSNKDLLRALKLEEKRKRLSSNYEYTLSFPGKGEEGEGGHPGQNGESRGEEQGEVDPNGIESGEEGENSETKDDKTSKVTEPLSKDMITHLVQENFTEGSHDLLPFDDKKTDLLTSILNSEAYLKEPFIPFADDDKDNGQPKATESEDVTKVEDEETTNAQKNKRGRPKTTKVQVNCPYNLRTKRKLVDPNASETTKISEITDNDSVKKAKLTPPEKISEEEAKLNAERFLTNSYLKSKKDSGSKEKKIDKVLETDTTVSGDKEKSIVSDDAIELICKDGFFYNRGSNEPITSGAYLKYKFKAKEKELLGHTLGEEEENKLAALTNTMGTGSKYDRSNVHFVQTTVEQETEFAFTVLSKTTLTESYVNSLEYFIMEFRWENKLVALGLKLRESKRTWQRRKALFTLFDFWRDQSIEKRNFPKYTMLHAIKEMDNYRIFINRSVSWFYNHITLLKMILYDLCDNVDTQWRDWMFPKDKPLPAIGGYDEATKSPITADNINAVLDRALVFDLLDDGTLNNEIKQSQVVAPKVEH